MGIGEPAKKKRELLDSLYIIMYGGTEGYQNHKDEVTNLALSGNQLSLNQAMRRDNAFESALKAYAKARKEVEEAGDTVSDAEKKDICGKKGQADGPFFDMGRMQAHGARISGGCV